MLPFQTNTLEGLGDVRFGSLGDMARPLCHVCFPQKRTCDLRVYEYARSSLSALLCGALRDAADPKSGQRSNRFDLALFPSGARRCWRPAYPELTPS